MTTWWQRGAIYQIYPRSYADANGDGVGDLRGIEQRLEHLSALGVEAVWLSPIFPSPMADFGYDVADYCDIDPQFGTLEDFDALTSACHARGIRIILDWVPNHTSDRHPWFEASRSSREDPKRDWYVWRDGAPDGGPPNDWESVFKAAGPAWTFDEATGQWYLHSFLAEQPDLNWDNPEVEAAMHDVLRFWFGRGVDGLRLDAISRIAKDPLLRDQTGRAAGAQRGLGHDPRAAARDPPGGRRVRGPHDRRRGRAARPAPHGQLPAPRQPAPPRAQLPVRRAGLGRGGVPHLDRRLRGDRRPGVVAGVVHLQPRQVAGDDALRRSARRGRSA